MGRHAVRESRQLAAAGRHRWNDAHIKPDRGTPVDTKDNFMRIAVIASVILVGALAIAVKLHS